MEINELRITVKELIDGYLEKNDGIDGVVAFGGRLDVRPPYQREYIYAPKERDEVIRTVRKGFPLNVMYWAKAGNDHYELMDGQQRTISICRYAAEKYQNYSADGVFFYNLQKDEQEDIWEYPLHIYICEGKPSEILAWFKVINIAGKVLSDQELLNTSYTGPWLSSAKAFFSKPNCIAYRIACDYVAGSPIRQEYLETALKWVVDRDKLESIKVYMGVNQNKPNADELINYFKDIIEWVEKVFIVKRKSLMKGLPWGLYYNRYHEKELDAIAIENEIKTLLLDDDIGNQGGIYEYILSRNEKHLNIRAFDNRDKRTVYERQNGLCKDCGGHFEIEEMEAHHKKRWVDGGHTTIDNCVMLCRDCHDKRHSHRD